MRAARYYGPGDVRVEDIPEPQVKPGQVKIKVSSVYSTRIGASYLKLHTTGRLVRLYFSVSTIAPRLDNGRTGSESYMQKETGFQHHD